MILNKYKILIHILNIYSIQDKYLLINNNNLNQNYENIIFINKKQLKIIFQLIIIIYK